MYLCMCLCYCLSKYLLKDGAMSLYLGYLHTGLYAYYCYCNDIQYYPVL